MSRAAALVVLGLAAVGQVVASFVSSDPWNLGNVPIPMAWTRVFLLLVLLAAGAVLWYLEARNQGRVLPDDSVFALVLVVYLLLLSVAVVVGELGHTRAALLALLGSCVASLLGHWSHGRHDEVTFERHWGGLGGSMGGWRVSRGMVKLLLVAMLLAALLAVFALDAPSSREGSDGRGAGASTTASAPPPGLAANSVADSVADPVADSAASPVTEDASPAASPTEPLAESPANPGSGPGS